MAPPMDSFKLQVHGVRPMAELDLGNIVGQFPDRDLLAVDTLAEAAAGALAAIAPEALAEAAAALALVALPGLEERDDLVDLSLGTQRERVGLLRRPRSP